MDRVVDIRNLKFAYREPQWVLDMPQFSLERGERVFIYGPSGSGKTTFLGLLAGVLQAQSGQIEVLGQDYRSMSAPQLDRFRGVHLGYIFQTFNLVPFLTVEENIKLGCDLNKQRRPKTQSLQESIEILLEHLGLRDVRGVSARELSVGQAQRVAAARALLGSPGLIIADEPTSSLDADHRNRFLDLLFAEIERLGSSLLFVSHDRSLEGRFTRSVSLPEINKVGSV